MGRLGGLCIDDTGKIVHIVINVVHFISFAHSNLMFNKNIQKYTNIEKKIQRHNEQKNISLTKS